jgi:glycosyltransferase involved in cell wall biosynthesis
VNNGGSRRRKVAFIEGFRKPGEHQPYGTHHSAHLTSHAVARMGQFEAIDLYQDRNRATAGHGELDLPSAPPVRVLDKPLLAVTRERYRYIFVANGEQILCAPHILRPASDAAPVICSIGTAHAPGQWSNLLVSLASGAIRPSDGFIFKSQRSCSLFQHVWEQWSDRLTGMPAFPATAVVPNGVDTDGNQRDDQIRNETRSELGLSTDDVLFLFFSRLGPATKGDLEALIVRFSEVTSRSPNARLLLAGAMVEARYVEDLRALAREAGLSQQVQILGNPFDKWKDARRRLMSAADVFVHLSTGVEETSALTVHEAMAHSMPVIAADWAGMSEVVVDGETGFLIGTRSVPLPHHLATTFFGQTDRGHLVHAGRATSCDMRAFVRAAVALLAPGRRSSMGAAARETAQANSTESIARQYVQFFDDRSQDALATWTERNRLPPLIDLNQVVSAQAGATLDPSTRVRLGDVRRGRLMTERLYPEPSDCLEAALACFSSALEVSVAQVAAAVAARAAAGSPDLDLPGGLPLAGRFVARLLNFGIIELAES